MARTESTWEEYDGSYVAVPWQEGRDVLIRGTNKYLNFGSLVGSSGYGFRDNAGVLEYKDSGDSWTTFESLTSLWQRITRNGVPLIEPVNSTDVLHLGTMTNFAPYSSVSGAKAWFTTQGEASFFTTITNGDPFLFFNAYGNMFTGFRGRGTIDSPTAVVAGDGLLTLLAGAFDSNNALTLTSSGKLLFAAFQVRALAPIAVGDVPQEIHIGTGLIDNGSIRVTSANELSFYKVAPIARPTNAIAAAAFVANTSGIVNDTATWGGYTGGQVVQALQNIGILT